jgi:nitrite reductase (NADH) small subunit
MVQSRHSPELASTRLGPSSPFCAGRVWFILTGRRDIAHQRRPFTCRTDNRVRRFAPDGHDCPSYRWQPLMKMSTTEPTNSDFITVAKVGAIPEGEGQSFQVGDRLVAVFLKDGRYFAIDDLCPHMGASLGAGYLDDEGVVTCPWHAWRFCVSNGKWADNPRLAVDTFDVRVADDKIQVRLARPDENGREGEGEKGRQKDTHSG